MTPITMMSSYLPGGIVDVNCSIISFIQVECKKAQPKEVMMPTAARGELKDLVLTAFSLVESNHIELF